MKIPCLEGSVKDEVERWRYMLFVMAVCLLLGIMANIIDEFKEKIRIKSHIATKPTRLHEYYMAPGTPIFNP